MRHIPATHKATCAHRHTHTPVLHTSPCLPQKMSHARQLSQCVTHTCMSWSCCCSASRAPVASSSCARACCSASADSCSAQGWGGKGAAQSPVAPLGSSSYMHHTPPASKVRSKRMHLGQTGQVFARYLQWLLPRYLRWFRANQPGICQVCAVLEVHFPHFKRQESHCLHPCPGHLVPFVEVTQLQDHCWMSKHRKMAALMLELAWVLIQCTVHQERRCVLFPKK